MSFHVRHWLGRELGVHEAHLHPVSDAPNAEGNRELRYLLSGRGIVAVTVVRAFHEATWRLEARWAAGEAATEVGIDQDVVA